MLLKALNGTQMQEKNLSLWVPVNDKATSLELPANSAAFTEDLDDIDLTGLKTLLHFKQIGRILRIM